MKIPKKVKVNGIVYDIKLVTNREDEIHEVKYYGSVNFDKNLITLYSDRKDENIFRTLMHEIIHIINEDLKMGLIEDNIRRLATGLYQSLKENNLLKEGE